MEDEECAIHLHEWDESDIDCVQCRRKFTLERGV